jgi:hypothetical protein
VAFILNSFEVAARPVECHNIDKQISSDIMMLLIGSPRIGICAYSSEDLTQLEAEELHFSLNVLIGFVLVID